MVTAAWASSRSAHPAAVVGREHQHLVDAAGRGLGEHRAQVLDPQRLVAVEGGVAVGHHPDHPLAVLAVGLEGRRGRLLVAGAERAGPLGVGLDGELAGHEVAGAVLAIDGDGDPAPGEGLSRSWLISDEAAKAGGG